MRTLVERNERFHGDTLHLISGDERITFRTFAQRARKLSSALYEFGLRHQDRVSILAMNCREYLEVDGAGELAGYIVSPVNFRLAAPEVQYILNTAAPKVERASARSVMDCMRRRRRRMCWIFRHFCGARRTEAATPTRHLC